MNTNVKTLYGYYVSALEDSRNLNKIAQNIFPEVYIHRVALIALSRYCNSIKVGRRFKKYAIKGKENFEFIEYLTSTKTTFHEKVEVSHEDLMYATGLAMKSISIIQRVDAAISEYLTVSTISYKSNIIGFMEYCKNIFQLGNCHNEY